MHVKDVLDNLDIVVDMPQHWYSTEVDNALKKEKLLVMIVLLKLKLKIIIIQNISL